MSVKWWGILPAAIPSDNVQTCFEAMGAGPTRISPRAWDKRYYVLEPAQSFACSASSKGLLRSSSGSYPYHRLFGRLARRPIVKKRWAPCKAPKNSVGA